MVKAVFTHADGSIYDDRPEARYHFPRTYLGVARRAVDDWIVYYEPRRLDASGRSGGRQVYFAVGQVERIERDPSREDRFYARIRPGTYPPFPSPVPFRPDGLHMESALRHPDGRTNRGAFGRSVREIPDAEFEAVVALGLAGLRAELGAEDWTPPAPGPRRDWGAFPEPEALEAREAPAAPPRRALVEQLSRRPLRDAAFARQVKSAYRETCAMTGLRSLRA